MVRLVIWLAINLIVASHPPKNVMLIPHAAPDEHKLDIQWTNVQHQFIDNTVIFCDRGCSQQKVSSLSEYLFSICLMFRENIVNFMIYAMITLKNIYILSYLTIE